MSGIFKSCHGHYLVWTFTFVRWIRYQGLVFLDSTQIQVTLEIHAVSLIDKIGHDGTVFEYTAPKYSIDKSIYDTRISKYKFLGQTEFEAQYHALIDLAELYDFSIRKVE